MFTISIQNKFCHWVLNTFIFIATSHNALVIILLPSLAYFKLSFILYLKLFTNQAF